MIEKTSLPNLRHIKYLIILALFFFSCKTAEKGHSQKPQWKQQAQTILGNNYESSVSSDKKYVLTYKLNTTTNLSLFELKWLVWNLETDKLQCKGENSASNIQWHTNTKLKFTKAMEMTQQGKSNRYNSFVDITNCKESKARTH